MTPRARQSLDSSLADYPRDARPPRLGWVRAIRDALGMSGSELGARLGVSRSAVSQLEKSEASESIRLATLRQAADALDCDLVYALVPRTGLEEQVARRARQKARAAIARADHSMALEDQALEPEALDQAVAELADELVDSPGLWSP